MTNENFQKNLIPSKSRVIQDEVNFSAQWRSLNNPVAQPKKAQGVVGTVSNEINK